MVDKLLESDMWLIVRDPKEFALRVIRYLNDLRDSATGVSATAGGTSTDAGVIVENSDDYEAGMFVHIRDGHAFVADQTGLPATHMVLESSLETDASMMRCVSAGSSVKVLLSGDGTSRVLFLGRNGKAALIAPTPSDDNTTYEQALGYRLSTETTGLVDCVLGISLPTRTV